MRGKEVPAVISYTLYRLSRDPVHFIILQEELERAGAELILVTEMVDSSDMGKLIAYIKGYAAKLEVEKIRERTTRGKLPSAKEGKQPGGRPKYGYKLVDGRHVIEPREAEVIRMVFDWLVRDDMSLRAIQHKLISTGIPTREGKSWWQRVTLYHIVTDPIYTGRWYYNKHTDAAAKTKVNGTIQVLKPKEQWIPVEVPSIISQETLEAAQRQLARNRQISRRNTKREYLLSGLLTCGNCGFNLIGRTTGGRAYYSCSSKSGNNRPKICFAKNIRGDSLEEVVWDNVSRLLFQPELIIEQVKNRGQANPGAYLEANLDRVSHALGRKKIEADRMLDAYKIGAIDLQTLKQKVDEIKNEEAGLNEEKLRLDKELHKAKAQDLNEEKLYHFCQSLPATLANLHFDDKRQILKKR
ncbi:hypothetical protein ES703_35678 [subsurface metagenome]